MHIEANCTQTGSSWPQTGGVVIRVLGGQANAVYTEIGLNFSTAGPVFYADHTRCCETPNTVIQRAPVPVHLLGSGLTITVVVDGGLIEAFADGLVTITPLVAPTAAHGAPSARTNTLQVSAPGVSCTAHSWPMLSLPPLPTP